MLSRLVLTDFRNHAALTLAPGPGFVVIMGENGAGKTNILEAVSLLAPGRGLRRAALGAMARQGGAGGFGVSAAFLPSRLREGSGEGVAEQQANSLQSNPSLPQPLPQAGGGQKEEEGLSVSLATGTLPTAPERRIVRIQGAPAAANTLAEWLTVIWLTPAMDRLFADPAGERRRFLDRLALALFPAHAGHAARYEAATRARTRLLSDPQGHDGEWVSALEAAMGEHGAALDAGRRETVAALGERLADQPAGPFARATLALEGGTVADLPTALAANRARDAAAGRALVGPHRADLLVTHADKAQAAALCSTGEQKALLLGIVLAHADLVSERAGAAPILLLDEVAAHLDPARRAALFVRLDGRGQVWMTGTEDALFAGLPGSATRLSLPYLPG